MRTELYARVQLHHTALLSSAKNDYVKLKITIFYCV